MITLKLKLKQAGTDGGIIVITSILVIKKMGERKSLGESLSGKHGDYAKFVAPLLAAQTFKIASR